VDFAHAAALAERIRRGENGALRQELLDLCLPYFSDLKTKWGFRWISHREVEELASDAINDAIFTLAGGKAAFWMRLQNAFRKCCRQRNRWRRRPTVETLVQKSDPARLVKITGSQPPTDTGSQHKELIELIHRELENHERTSKTAIYERMRGASYEEIATILSKDAHRSRALFWDDVKQIRKNGALRRCMKDEDRSSAVPNTPSISED
jgi:hypothetical protein